MSREVVEGVSTAVEVTMHGKPMSFDALLPVATANVARRAEWLLIVGWAWWSALDPKTGPKWPLFGYAPAVTHQPSTRSVLRRRRHLEACPTAKASWTRSASGHRRRCPRDRPA
jgi:hypothetical protein